MGMSRGMGMGIVFGIGVIVVAISFAAFGVFGFPVLGVLLIAAVVYFLAAGKDSGVGTVERSKRPEPTGMPRPSGAAGDTATERQGQV